MRFYCNQLIAELTRELISGLIRLRQGFLDRAEELIALLDPEQTYPYAFVVFRITGYRPDDDPAEMLEGESLRADLLNLMLDVSESFELRTSDYDEKTYDTRALARYCDVSTKTIQRWRKQGLVARRLVFPDGRRRIGFLERSVRRFIASHDGQVQRSSQFSHMSDDQRERLIAQARRTLRDQPVSLSELSRRLAERTGRAVETVRYTIRHHDNAHPRQALFPDLLTHVDERDKQRIFRQFMRGQSVPRLARRYHRSRSSVYRIVNEVRARKLIQRKIDYIHNDEFEADHAEATILHGAAGTSDQAHRDATTFKAPADLPPYLRSLYDVPLLSADQERDLFRRYNFLKYLADRKRQSLDPKTVTSSQLKEIESLLLQANILKNRIVRANLRLVVSIAKKHVSGPLGLFELISDGNVSLMRAVEKFDYARGYRFSTYASWAIMRNFARSVPRERNQLDRFATGNEEVLDIAAGLQSYDPQEPREMELRESINLLLDHLSPRERTILIDHYGLSDSTQSKTFEQLGEELGISKERVRQIEIQALDKLRELEQVDVG